MSKSTNTTPRQRRIIKEDVMAAMSRGMTLAEARGLARDMHNLDRKTIWLYTKSLSPVVDKEERNASIMSMLLKGYKAMEVARKHSVSDTIVYQVANQSEGWSKEMHKKLVKERQESLYKWPTNTTAGLGQKVYHDDDAW